MQNHSELITNSLKSLKIDSLNEIQLASLDAMSKNNEIVLLSPTGSGKTLAFLLPVLETLSKDISNVQVLILAPSRELALQIEQVFRSMSTGFKINSCYGGHDVSTEKRNFSEPPAVLVGTPGRITEHITKGNFDTTSIHTVVFDEFDKSLEFGFHQEMSAIMSGLDGVKRRILTSATQAVEIPAFTGVESPVYLDFLGNKETLKGLSLKTVISPDKDKVKTLFKLICQLAGEPTLVFCNHRDAVDRISKFLNDYKIPNDVFHGGLEQYDRERSLVKFRNGSCNVLIATDLAARGLDIPEIKYIVHYQLPTTEESYVHRNGRTARMNAEGTSFLVLSAEEYQPVFIQSAPDVVELPEEIELPPLPQWASLYISKGRKDKISKMDIVGFLAKKAMLTKEEIGMIEVKDYFSYVAIKRDKIRPTLNKIKEEKIKNMKAKFEISF